MLVKGTTDHQTPICIDDIWLRSNTWFNTRILIEVIAADCRKYVSENWATISSYASFTLDKWHNDTSGPFY